MKHQIYFLFFAFAISACNPRVEWISTTEQRPWQEHQAVFSEQLAENHIKIMAGEPLHTIEGFGACFNELGWTSLSMLPESDREFIMKELFEPGAGANFTICRMPLAANDFSREWYSYNETDGDFTMKHFSIENDLETLVPFIHHAKKHNRALKIWASPWSPPSWMKWNKHYACAITNESLAERFQNHLTPDQQGKEGTNMFIQENAYFQSYALYFSKFIDAYRKQGIEISMIMPQNEFNSCQVFPSCTWTAAGLATFIGRYLGPAMAEKNVEIMFGTMERPATALVDTILNDTLANRYVKGIGFQWAGKKAMPDIHRRYPDLKLYQTEQECGDGKNDWRHCEYAWSLMKHYLTHGASAYLYWNISLEKGGVSRWGWRQNSLISVNPESKTYNFNHEYYLMKHVSRFVQPGAKLVKTDGKFTDILAFVNPDKSVVAVLHNELDQENEVSIEVGKKNLLAKLAARSFNTFVFR